MNTSVNKIFSSGRMIHSAGLFALALMLLVISCPLKKLLQNNVASHSSLQKTKQININQPRASQYSSAVSCSAIREKTLLVKSNLIQLKAPSSLYFPDRKRESGFEINYFLSRTNSKCGFSASSNLSSLPLFLQHLRLRI